MEGEYLGRTSDGYNIYQVGNRTIQVPSADKQREWDRAITRAQEENKRVVEERERRRLEQGNKLRPIFRAEKWKEWLGK